MVIGVFKAKQVLAGQKLKIDKGAVLASASASQDHPHDGWLGGCPKMAPSFCAIFYFAVDILDVEYRGKDIPAFSVRSDSEID